MTGKTIADSTLFKLARATPLLTHLIPSIDMRIKVESIFDVSPEFSREDSEKDVSRIFIMYHNEKGNSYSVKLAAPADPLTSTFDIDGFLSKYQFKVFEGLETPTTDSVETINGVIQSVIEFATRCVLGMEDESLKPLGSAVIGALVTIVLNDPLDAIITINEVKNTHDDEYSPRVMGMWAIKTR